MKIFHVSDLHIGKHLNTYNLKELQKGVLNDIILKVSEEKPDVLIVAGDIYDKSIPSSEAFDLFDEFLSDYAKMNPDIPMFVIAGNHDDTSRLNFGSTFFKNHNIYISTLPPQSEDEFLMKKTLKDGYGDVDFYLLPFTRPSMIRSWNSLTNYNEVIQFLIEREEIDYQKRNVLISHQFYKKGELRPERSTSEFNYNNIGGLDAVEVDSVKDFDYVALGHIHGNQKVGYEHIRYSGTPLKYSLSEIEHTKVIQVIELKEKGNITYDTIPLISKPLIRSIKGTLKEVLDAANEENKNDYVYITLVERSINPLDALREKYTNIIEVTIKDGQTYDINEDLDLEVKELDPFEIFKEFYTQMKNEELDEAQSSLMNEIIEEASKRVE